MSGELNTGSEQRTSEHAASSRPDVRAANSAASSTSSPLAVLIRTQPGCSDAKVSALYRPRVADVSGTWIDSTSDFASSVAKLTACTPCSV